MPSVSPAPEEHDHDHDQEQAEAGADGAAAGYAHPYYSYAVPPGTPGSPSQSGENGVQVVYPPPPGGYWPPGYMAIPVPMHMPSGGGGTSANGKPKRKQVKNACTNCQTACKRCEDARPCARCVKYGLADSCINSARKERKKGIKRGPYKKRKEGGGDGMEVDEASMAMDAMMPPGAGAYHPGALPPGYPEGGYYSYFPGYAFQGGPGHLVPATHEGEEGEEDAEDGERAAVAAAHYYYPYYALPPGAMPPSDKKEDEDGNEEEEVAPPPAPEPVAPPPKKSRKKAAGDDGDKPKARGKKKKAAAAPPPPPPPGEEDELDPEDEIKDE